MKVVSLNSAPETFCVAGLLAYCLDELTGNALQLCRHVNATARSGNGVGRINEVYVEPGYIFLGWVTVFCTLRTTEANSAFYFYNLSLINFAFLRPGIKVSGVFVSPPTFTVTIVGPNNRYNE